MTRFVLSGVDLPTVYISGDHASLDVVRSVRERAGRIDVALLFAGAARLPDLDGAPMTLTAADAVLAAEELDASVVIPLHARRMVAPHRGVADLQRAFEAAGLGGRIRVGGVTHTQS